MPESHLALKALHHILDVAQGVGRQVLGQHAVKLLVGHQQPQDLASIVPAQSDQVSSAHSLAEKHRHCLLLLLPSSLLQPGKHGWRSNQAYTLTEHHIHCCCLAWILVQLAKKKGKQSNAKF